MFRVSQSVRAGMSRSLEVKLMLKCTDPADAIHKSRRHAVLDPKLPGTLTLDVTRLTPEQRVAAIIAHIKRLGR